MNMRLIEAFEGLGEARLCLRAAGPNSVISAQAGSHDAERQDVRVSGFPPAQE
jgi:hypothetical protein